MRRAFFYSKQVLVTCGKSSYVCIDKLLFNIIVIIRIVYYITRCIARTVTVKFCSIQKKKGSDMTQQEKARQTMEAFAAGKPVSADALSQARICLTFSEFCIQGLDPDTWTPTEARSRIDAALKETTIHSPFF